MKRTKPAPTKNFNAALYRDKMSGRFIAMNWPLFFACTAVAEEHKFFDSGGTLFGAGASAPSFRRDDRVDHPEHAYNAPTIARFLNFLQG